MRLLLLYCIRVARNNARLVFSLDIQVFWYVTTCWLVNSHVHWGGSNCSDQQGEAVNLTRPNVTPDSSLYRNICENMKSLRVFSFPLYKPSPFGCINTGGFNPLNTELNPICCLPALLGAHHFLHVSRIRVKSLTLRLLMSYIHIHIYIYIYIYMWSAYSWCF